MPDMVRGLKNGFRNLPIQSKMFLVYIPLIIIPLFVLGYVSSSISTKAIVDKTVKNLTDNSGLILTRLGGMLTNAESCANELTLSLNRVLVDNKAAGGQSELQRTNDIRNQLRFALLVFPDVESAAFVDEQGRLYGSQMDIERNVDEAIRSPMLEELRKTNGNNRWFPMQRRTYLTVTDADPVLSVGKKIIHIQTGQQLGLLVLNIRESAISAIYGRDGSQVGDSFITDAQGIVISTLKQEQLLKPVDNAALREELLTKRLSGSVQRLDGVSTLVLSADYPSFGWHLVTEVPLRRLTDDNRKITLSIVWIGLVCLIFAVLGARILSQLIVSPLIKLTKTMRRFTGENLDMEIQVESADETGLLAAGFNTMLRRMRELLGEVRAEQRNKREFELALIQSQIKPHFLYNTLDVIYTLSEMGRVKDVQKTTKALADFYRVALSGGREEITIEEEIRNVKDYLAIQRIRYADVFDYDIEVQSEVLQQPILKLTVQPLVENAIYHGLKEKGSFGKLTIRAGLYEDKVLLRVSDDGVGMPEDQMNLFLHGKGTKPSRASFGLRNVDERIRLYFGEQYGLGIESAPGLGTTVTIMLPLQDRKGKNERD